MKTLLLCSVSLMLMLALCLPLTSLASAEIGDAAPEFSAERWINSEKLSLAELRGKVVLVEFWTFACWNCKNVEPHVKRWHAKYRDDGFVVVAVHTPEFSFEKDLKNVKSMSRSTGSPTPSPSTTTSRPGAPTETGPGPRSTWWARTVVSASIASAKAATTRPKP